MTADDVARWIREARKSRGWTQDQLGDLVGVTKANVSHWETGKHEPSFLQLLKIRDVTGYALVEVPSGDWWPLPAVRREQITALNPIQRQQLAIGLNALLAALAVPVPDASGHRLDDDKRKSAAA